MCGPFMSITCIHNRKVTGEIQIRYQIDYLGIYFPFSECDLCRVMYNFKRGGNEWIYPISIFREYVDTMSADL